MKVINILLVEDDSLDIMDIQRTLKKMDILYNLNISKNGEEAVAFLQETEALPDVVLIDINMPKMNGLELLKVIRNTNDWKHLKCFIITTSEENVDKRVARELGVSGYIIKPFKLNSTKSLDAFNLMIDLMNMKS